MLLKKVVLRNEDHFAEAISVWAKQKTLLLKRLTASRQF